MIQQQTRSKTQLEMNKIEEINSQEQQLIPSNETRMTENTFSKISRSVSDIVGIKNKDEIRYLPWSIS